MTSVDLDQIGYWSEVKLDIVQKYAAAYSRIMSCQRTIRGHAYIDAFAGAGVHLAKGSQAFVPGSPLNALSVRPPFTEFHFIDLDGGRAARLRELTSDRSDVRVYEDDCNSALLNHVFPRCEYADYRRALCLLDPYGLSVDWAVLRKAASMQSIEVFYNFMIMDANMNVLLRDPDRVPEPQRQRLDLVWGDRTWRDIAYRRSPGLFHDIETKLDNDAIAEAFRTRLQNVAGFKFVPSPMPMRNSKGAVVYYLYFASHNATGGRIVEDIFRSYRDKGVA